MTTNELSPLAKIILAVGFLFTGSLNTIGNPKDIYIYIYI